MYRASTPFFSPAGGPTAPPPRRMWIGVSECARQSQDCSGAETETERFFQEGSLTMQAAAPSGAATIALSRVWCRPMIGAWLNACANALRRPVAGSGCLSLGDAVRLLPSLHAGNLSCRTSRSGRPFGPPRQRAYFEAGACWERRRPSGRASSSRQSDLRHPDRRSCGAASATPRCGGPRGRGSIGSVFLFMISLQF